jgi:hypothetical protein
MGIKRQVVLRMQPCPCDFTHSQKTIGLTVSAAAICSTATDDSDEVDTKATAEMTSWRLTHSLCRARLSKRERVIGRNGWRLVWRGLLRSFAGDLPRRRPVHGLPGAQARVHVGHTDGSRSGSRRRKQATAFGDAPSVKTIVSPSPHSTKRCLRLLRSIPPSNT